MALLFISNVVPDSDEYRNNAFNRSGNNVVMGICDSLPRESGYTLISCRPVPSFPRGKLYFKGEKTHLNSGREVYLIPTFNLKLIKNIFWGIWLYVYIKRWVKTNTTDHRGILVYNIYTPPISWLYKAAKKTHSRLYAILYDLGVPPKRLGLSKLTMIGYRMMEKEAHKYIPLLDGRIVINESIIEHYAPGKDFVLIDGGVGQNIIKRLFPLDDTHTGPLHLVCAGLLWDQNGTKLILSALRSHPELDVVIHFAGHGVDVPLIRDAMTNDSRIRYEGMLTIDKLFELYEKSDILLNLRLEEEIDFHFPSKLLEYMATGRYVISTPVAHAERDYGKFISILHDISPEGLSQKIKELQSIGRNQLISKGKLAREYMLTYRQWCNRTQEIIGYLDRNES